MSSRLANMNSLNARSAREQRRYCAELSGGGMDYELARQISRIDTRGRRRLSPILGFDAAFDRRRVRTLLIERDDGTITVNLTGNLDQTTPEQLDRMMCKGKRVDVPCLSLILAGNQKQKRRSD